MTDSNVFEFLSEEKQRMKELGRIRASENCHAAARSLLAFWGDTDLTFGYFTSSLMEAYEAYLKQRGLMRNTSSYYMRCLRSVYNRAVERGVTVDLHPFRHVFTTRDKTIKRALNLESIKKLMKLDLSGNPTLDYARDIFLFSFYTRGMPFVDMAFLRKSDFQGSYLVYFRKKTGQMLQVEWLPCMQAILDKYPENPTPYLLPIITNESKDPRTQYLQRMRSVNRNLKKVAQYAQLPVNLSSYFARHSWASLAYNMKVQIAVISEALGHDNQATTQIYLDSISSAAVDDANRNLLGLFGL